MRSRVPEQRAEYGSIFPAGAARNLVEDATNGKVQLAPFATHAESLSDNQRSIRSDTQREVDPSRRSPVKHRKGA